ncbi:MAG: hypothetical protein ACJAT1_001206 [Marivirga sp.]|jgi:uncharacterized protein YbbC (DUF1343 family)
MIKNAKYNIISKVIASLLLFLFINITSTPLKAQTDIILGAEQLALYTPLLQNKNIALVVNHSSIIARTHLVDTLLSLQLAVKRVFAPEHGFRGTADAGATVASGKDAKTGLPIISLYGKNKKPSKEQLKGIDIVVFDIQDVGTRFYTYISTMHYVMEACAENEIPLIVLDRPNPNGQYIDGPILEMENQSFVGMHPIPILHGLTVGELAQMINKEQWLSTEMECDLTIIPMKKYTHDTFYSLPIKPSPNLPTDLSIKLYPSLCLFEGTVISVGRGTYFPFQQIGHPQLNVNYSYSFFPISMQGSQHPPFENQACYGIKFDNDSVKGGLQLTYLMEMYHQMPDSAIFFNNFFTKLVGTTSLEQQIKADFTADEIKLSWQENLATYRIMRERYLMYP